jgi:putative heme iron utilization protein
MAAKKQASKNQNMIVMGKELLLFQPARKTTSGPVPNTVLSWGDKTMIIDTQNLPMNIVKLLPPGYLVNDDPSKWESFIMACLAKGYLK